MVLGWGQFSKSDASAVNAALLGFLASLSFFAYGTFLSRLLVAQHKPGVLSISSLITLAVVSDSTIALPHWADAIGVIGVTMTL